MISFANMPPCRPREFSVESVDMLRRMGSPFLQAALALWCDVAAAAQDHAGQYSQGDIERGSRLYGANCAVLPRCERRCGRERGSAKRQVPEGDFRRRSGPPHHRRSSGHGHAAAQVQNAELTGIVAYIRSMRDVQGATVAVRGRGRGKEIFAGKGACMSCHRVNGQGSRLAPDLSEIGMVRPAAACMNALLDPTASMLQSIVRCAP